MISCFLAFLKDEENLFSNYQKGPNLLLFKENLRRAVLVVPLNTQSQHCKHTLQAL